MGIDKEGFVENLLEGNGYPANGTFPAGSAFGGDKVTTETYLSLIHILPGETISMIQSGAPVQPFSESFSVSQITLISGST